MHPSGALGFTNGPAASPQLSSAGKAGCRHAWSGRRSVLADPRSPPSLLPDRLLLLFVQRLFRGQVGQLFWVEIAWGFTLPAQQGLHTEPLGRLQASFGLTKRFNHPHYAGAADSSSRQPAGNSLTPWQRPLPERPRSVRCRKPETKRSLLCGEVVWCCSGCGPFPPKPGLENESRLLGFASCFLLASLPDSLTSAGCCSSLHSGAIGHKAFLTILDDFGVGEKKNPSF